ncbi:MAG: hypothetical protein WBN71_00005, partial [Acidimicrobiia bacterium]
PGTDHFRVWKGETSRTGTIASEGGVPATLDPVMPAVSGGCRPQQPIVEALEASLSLRSVWRSHG